MNDSSILSIKNIVMSFLEFECICSNDKEDNHCLLNLTLIAIDFCTHKFCINKLLHEIENN